MELLSVEGLIFALPMTVSVVLIVLMAIGIPLSEGAEDGAIAAQSGDAAGADVLSPGILHSALSFFGIGSVPLALWFVSESMLWGMTGLSLILLKVTWPLGAKVAVAGVVAHLGTKLVVATVGKWLPSVESYGVPSKSLVSEYAEVLHEVTPEGGTVRLLDSRGNLRDLASQLAPGAANIPRGARVILSEYDEQADRYIVKAQPLDDQPPQRSTNSVNA